MPTRCFSEMRFPRVSRGSSRRTLRVSLGRSWCRLPFFQRWPLQVDAGFVPLGGWRRSSRSEEHTSELQSRQYLVCRLLLEKKKASEYNCSESSSAEAICGCGSLAKHRVSI